MLTLESTSEEICEALVRYTEMTGSDVFGKDFVKIDKLSDSEEYHHIGATCWCVVGENAELFNEHVAKWLADNGYNQDV